VNDNLKKFKGGGEFSPLVIWQGVQKRRGVNAAQRKDYSTRVDPLPQVSSGRGLSKKTATCVQRTTGGEGKKRDGPGNEEGS